MPDTRPAASKSTRVRDPGDRRRARRRPRVAIMSAVALVAAAVLAVAAQGASHAQRLHFAGERILHDSRIAHMVDLAQRHWRARDVDACAKPIVMSAPTLTRGKGASADGYAELGGCHVWLRSRFLDQSLRFGRSRDLRVLCAVVVHELGHTAGLHHAAQGIMRPIVRPGQEPRVCVDAYR